MILSGSPFYPHTDETVLEWVLLTFMVFNSEPIMKIKSLSWMNSISFLRNSNSMTHPFIILFHFNVFFISKTQRGWLCRDRLIFLWSRFIVLWFKWESIHKPWNIWRPLRIENSALVYSILKLNVKMAPERPGFISWLPLFWTGLWNVELNGFFSSRERDSMVVLKLKLIWCHRLIKFSQFEALYWAEKGVEK